VVRLRTATLAVSLLLCELTGTALSETLLVAPGELESVLARARTGDELVLESGRHPGPIRIEKSLRLRGEPGAVLAGPGEGTVLTLAADGIELKDLTVRGSGMDLSRDDAVVLLLEARNILVENCLVESRAFGIYLRGGGGHRVRHNRIEGDASLDPARRGNGIHLWHSERNEVSDNRIAATRDGIYLSFAHENLISRNEGTSLRYGIHYMYSERNTLTGNRFTRSTGGIALMFSLGNRIESNETHDNRDFGILCQQLERSTLVANRARGNGRGFYLENSAGNELARNELAANGVGAYLTAGSERNSFHENRFEGNLVQVFQDHAGSNVWSRDGRGNYWSDYVGLDWNGDGVGDVPYRLQTATSALMARRPTARILWMSPLWALLDWWDERVLLPTPGSLDAFPLVSRPKGADR
jgi:nitrous oxidase accessory protein